MSSLLVVVKSHLFPQFIQLNREIGSGRVHWGDRRVWGCQSRVGGHCTRELLGAAAVQSIVTDGQYIGNEVAAAVTHNSRSDSQ